MCDIHGDNTAAVQALAAKLAAGEALTPDESACVSRALLGFTALTAEADKLRAVCESYAEDNAQVAEILKSAVASTAAVIGKPMTGFDAQAAQAARVALAEKVKQGSDVGAILGAVLKFGLSMVV